MLDKSTDNHAERALIGAVLLDPDVVLGEIASTLSLDDFHDPRCRALWRAVCKLYDSSRPVDVVTLESSLRADGVLDSVGYEFLCDTALLVPTSDNSEHYAGIVATNGLTRRIATLGGYIVETIRQGKVGHELLSLVQGRISAMDRARDVDLQSSRSMLETEYHSIISDLEQASITGRMEVGIPTGIRALDELIGGIPRNIITLVGATPGTGKSTLAISIAEHAAMQGYGVHSITYEDSYSTYAQRVLGLISGIDISRIRGRSLQRADLSRLLSAIERYKPPGWWLEAAHGLPVDALIRRIKARKRKINTALVIVDYIQNIPSPRGEDDRVMGIERNLGALEVAAAKENLAMIVMSQLSRAYSAREDKRPQLYDFRGSGALEQKAKVIIGMFAPYKQKERTYGRNHPLSGQQVLESHLELGVLKNSQGPSGVTITVNYDHSTGRIR